MSNYNSECPCCDASCGNVAFVFADGSVDRFCAKCIQASKEKKSPKGEGVVMFPLSESEKYDADLERISKLFTTTCGINYTLTMQASLQVFFECVKKRDFAEFEPIYEKAYAMQAPIMRSATAAAAEEQKVAGALCPWVIETKSKDKKVCGRKAKENGFCGIHRNKAGKDLARSA